MPKVVAERARLPETYGLPPNSPLLAWSTVEARLERARHYWLAVGGGSDVPIVRPIDGLWVQSALYFDGDPDTRWRRSLAARPEASVTLETAESAVILEGAVSRTTPETDLATALAAQANAKYESVELTAADYEVEICVFKAE